MSSPALLLGDDNITSSNTGGGSGPTGVSGGPTGTSGSTSGGSVNHVVVSSLVLFHILDHHSRRADVDGRVIGTLLGRRLDGTGTIEVTNAFSVPHAERGDEVAIGKDFNKKMYNLHKRINRKEVVVGWYASAAANNTTSDLVTDTSSLIHEFYASESDEEEPVHLVVDTRLLLQNSAGPSVSVRAFKSSPVIVQGEHLGNLFHELRLTLQSSEPESICLHEMIKSEGLSLLHLKEESEQKQEHEHDALQVSMEKLYETLSKTLEYVDNVVDNKIPANAEIGRQIADTLATVPRVRPEIFESLFHNSLQDLLMVTYLANITRSQITIAEKLNASLGA